MLQEQLIGTTILHNFAFGLHLVIADSEEDKPEFERLSYGSEAISIKSQRDFDPAILSLDPTLMGKDFSV